MKIWKNIMVLVLLPLFFGLGYADSNVSKKSSVPKIKTEIEWIRIVLIKESWDINMSAVTELIKTEKFKNYNPLNGDEPNLVFDAVKDIQDTEIFWDFWMPIEKAKENLKRTLNWEDTFDWDDGYIDWKTVQAENEAIEKLIDEAEQKLLRINLEIATK